MEAIKLTYVLNAFVVLGLTILSSVMNVREVSRKKCGDRKLMRNYMYLAISVIVWTFISNIFFYYREYTGMEFYSFGNWDRNAYITIGSASILAVLAFFTSLNIDLSRNDTNRYLSICKNLNVSGLHESGISKKSTADTVKDIFSYKERLDNVHAKWSVQDKPKMTREDIDEWNALKSYSQDIKLSDFDTFLTKENTYESEWAFISDSVYKNKAKNWLKDMNTYPDDEVTFKETALLTDMYKSAGCQELRFYNFVKGKSGTTTLTKENLLELHAQFKADEPVLYSDSLKEEIDDDFLKSFNIFVNELKPSDPKKPDKFTGKYKIDSITSKFLNAEGKTCESVNNSDTRDKIFKHTLHIEQIKTMVTDMKNKYNTLSSVFSDDRIGAYKANVALQDDYLRRRIIAGFVWCMVLWPSFQSHAFVAQMYTAFGSESNSYVFFAGSVFIPIWLGITIYGGDVRKDLTDIKNLTKMIKEIQNAKL